MIVKELIKQLADEDMDMSIMVRIENKDGTISFHEIDGLAVVNDSFRPANNIYCPTILIGGISK